MATKRIIRTSIATCMLLIGSVGLFLSFRTAEAKYVSVSHSVSQPKISIAKAEPATVEKQLRPPISNALNRMTKKTFGLEVHPDTSPVANDKFNGFHAGVDFETTVAEQEIDVPITAACTGPLIFKTWAHGYGGVAVQHCILDNEDVSVIYGHLYLESVSWNDGDTIRTGQKIGVLGAAYSFDTDGVRKHLHFGLRKGLTDDIRGYVKDASELGEFLDARKYIQF